MTRLRQRMIDDMTLHGLKRVGVVGPMRTDTAARWLNLKRSTTRAQSRMAGFAYPGLEHRKPGKEGKEGYARRVEVGWNRLVWLKGRSTPVWRHRAAVPPKG